MHPLALASHDAEQFHRRRVGTGEPVRGRRVELGGLTRGHDELLGAERETQAATQHVEPVVTVVGALHGPDRDKGAPVYILKGDKVVSTIMPKEELGLEKFQHIHNATMRTVEGKIYLIVQAWNPGDFAVLEQVAN